MSGPTSQCAARPSLGASAADQQVFVRGVLTGFDEADNCTVTGPEGALVSRDASELLPANKSDDALGKHSQDCPRTLTHLHHNCSPL